MGIVVAVVIVVVVIFVAMAFWYRRPPQLTRHLRSTGFSRRRSDAIREAAAADVAEILEQPGFAPDSPGLDPDGL